MRKPFIKHTILLSLALVMALSCSCKDKAATGTKADFSDNWTTYSGRYLKSGNLIKESEGDGISFANDETGGIYVNAGEGKGYVATSILTSKHKTPLDNLTVKLVPDKMDFTDDEYSRSQIVSVMWTQDEILPMSEALGHFDHSATNGIRNTAQPTKGICVVLNNTYIEYAGTKNASNVMITLIDGEFHDVSDHRLGYRWSFTARNFLSQSSYSDATKIVSRYEKVDISDGLYVHFRKDERLGYIVSINGIDYFSSSTIAYYPNNVSDELSEESMTYQRNDIDLNALNGVTDGYVSVGVSGTVSGPGKEYSYTLAEINGKAAASWTGEEAEN